MLPRQARALTAKARKMEFQAVISKLLERLCPEGCEVGIQLNSKLRLWEASENTRG